MMRPTASGSMPGGVLVATKRPLSLWRAEGLSELAADRGVGFFGEVARHRLPDDLVASLALGKRDVDIVQQRSAVSERELPHGAGMGVVLAVIQGDLLVLG